MNEKHPRNLHEAALDRYQACSRRSYMRMKAAIAKADGADSQGAWTSEMCAGF
jgi:hypothetical protein